MFGAPNPGSGGMHFGKPAEKPATESAGLEKPKVPSPFGGPKSDKKPSDLPDFMNKKMDNPLFGKKDDKAESKPKSGGLFGQAKSDKPAEEEKKTEKANPFGASKGGFNPQFTGPSKTGESKPSSGLPPKPEGNTFGAKKPAGDSVFGKKPEEAKKTEEKKAPGVGLFGSKPAESKPSATLSPFGQKKEEAKAPSPLGGAKPEEAKGEP